MTTAALQEKQIRVKEQCLYMIFELSNKEWKLAFGIGGNCRIRTIWYDPTELESFGKNLR